MDRIHVMQLVRSFQCGELTRRDFLRQATIALGSVASANLLLNACTASPATNPPPVIEETAPATDLPADPTAAEAAGEASADGLVTEMVDYEDTDGEILMGYLARPTGDEPLPAIVVIQEWWGLNDHIKDVARRFANEGYVALAPDLYHGAVTTEPDEARKLVMELDSAEAVSEIQRAIAFLLEQEYVAGSEAGIVGFCMGGGLVLQTALVEDNLAAGVAFYGRPIDPAQASEVKAPILGLYGSEDGGIPVADVEALQTALEEAGIENEFQIYEGAQHAFFNETRESSYAPDAAADAWQRTLTWFEQHLSA